MEIEVVSLEMAVVDAVGEILVKGGAGVNVNLVHMDLGLHQGAGKQAGDKYQRAFHSWLEGFSVTVWSAKRTAASRWEMNSMVLCP